MVIPLIFVLGITRYDYNISIAVRPENTAFLYPFICFSEIKLIEQT